LKMCSIWLYWAKEICWGLFRDPWAK